MLLKNDLLQYVEEGGQTVRILWLRADSAGAAIIDVQADNALPTIVSAETLIQDIQAGRARLLKPDPYIVLAVEAVLPDSYRVIRDNAWRCIRKLVENEPDIYRPNKRGKLLKVAMAEHKVTLKMFYRYLRRYWQRGQTPNALFPIMQTRAGVARSASSPGRSAVGHEYTATRTVST